jgi:hypothetical protein
MVLAVKHTVNIVITPVAIGKYKLRLPDPGLRDALLAIRAGPQVSHR